MQRRVANGERPVKKNTTQRRAKSSEKKKGVETGRRAPKVVSTKVKAQSRPRIERASKGEVVEHNRLVPRSNRGCPIPSFLGKHERNSKISKNSPNRKSIKSPKPYKGYDVYGPRIENTGRWSVSLVHRETKKQFTKSLARYVMEVGLGRRLFHNVHVDHIDGNCLNDKWNNLQVLKASENISKANPNMVATATVFKCATCRTSVTQTKSRHLDSRVRFCSKVCLTKFQIISRSFRDKQVVAIGIATNATKHIAVSRKSLHESVVGERIHRKTKGMRRIHNFTKLKGVSIL